MKTSIIQRDFDEEPQGFIEILQFLLYFWFNQPEPSRKVLTFPCALEAIDLYNYSSNYGRFSPTFSNSFAIIQFQKSMSNKVIFNIFVHISHLYLKSLWILCRFIGSQRKMNKR